MKKKKSYKTKSLQIKFDAISVRVEVTKMTEYNNEILTKF